MFSDHSSMPQSRPLTPALLCSSHCHPNWPPLPRPPRAANTIIYKYWSLYKLCQGTQSRARPEHGTNLYWIYTPSILWDTQIPAIQSNSARIVAHTWRAWQISCGLRAAANSLSTPVTSFVTWIGHPCAPNNASPALSPETLEKCSAVWI